MLLKLNYRIIIVHILFFDIIDLNIILLRMVILSMKNAKSLIRTKKITYSALALLLILVIALFSGCKSNNDTDSKDEPTNLSANPTDLSPNDILIQDAKMSEDEANQLIEELYGINIYNVKYARLLSDNDSYKTYEIEDDIYKYIIVNYQTAKKGNVYEVYCSGILLYETPAGGLINPLNSTDLTKEQVDVFKALAKHYIIQDLHLKNAKFNDEMEVNRNYDTVTVVSSVEYKDSAENKIVNKSFAVRLSYSSKGNELIEIAY